MGGTKIFEPMSEVFSWPLDKNLPRQIYLLTDGEVENTKAVVNLIKSNSKNCRVHTFGIGEGASSELIKDCAVAG